MIAGPRIVTKVRHLLTDFLLQSLHLISFKIFITSYKIIQIIGGNSLMSISCSVAVQSIFRCTKFVALLTIVARAPHMLYFDVVLHVCCMLAYIITISALPSPRRILEHLQANQRI